MCSKRTPIAAGKTPPFGLVRHSTRVQEAACLIVAAGLTLASACSKTEPSSGTNPTDDSSPIPKQMIQPASLDLDRPSEDEARERLDELNARLKSDPGDAEGYFERGRARQKLAAYVSAADRIESDRDCAEDFMLAHDVAGGDLLIDPVTGKTLSREEAHASKTDDSGHLVGFEGVRRDHGALIIRDESGTAHRVGGPGHARALVEAARIGIKYYQFEWAADCVERAARIEPSAVFVRAEQSRMKGYLKNDWAAATSELESLVLDAAPDEYLRLMFSLALSYEHLGHLRRSESAYREFLRLDPNNYAVLNNLGRLLVSVGRTSEGTELLKQAITDDPRNVIALINLSNTLTDQGKPEDALDIINKAIELVPSIPAAWNNKAAALADLGRWEEAVTACEQSIRLLPTHPDGHYNLGTILSELDEFERAADAFRRALELSGKNPMILYNYARTLAEMEDFEASEDVYRRLLKIDQRDSRAWNNLGNVLFEMARYKEAKKAFEESISRDPSNVNAINNLGNTHLQTGHLQEARHRFNEVLRLDPTSERTLWILVGSYLVDGRSDQAATTVEAVIQSTPTEAYPYRIRAHIHAYDGELDVASKLLNKAIDIDDEDAGGYFSRSLIGWQQGQFGHAVDDLNRFLVIKPKSVMGRMYLSLIEQQRGHGDAAVALRNAARHLAYERSWNAKVLRYLDGELGEEELLALAISREQRSQAYYFIAETLRMADEGAAKARYADCVDTNHPQGTEYRLAKWRLDEYESSPE
jgi:tetratricopeptide (TPR) repeat protein